MLAKDIIEPSYGPLASPVVFVKKMMARGAFACTITASTLRRKTLTRYDELVMPLIVCVGALTSLLSTFIWLLVDCCGPSGPRGNRFLKSRWALPV